MLGDHEIKILAEIRKNPYISQMDLAEKIGLSRSAVAGLISGLTREGEILGKAYVLNEDKHQKIVCVGGANIDQKWLLHETFQLHTSNPASIKWSIGGVVRNVAENLGRLSQLVTLLTITGKDHLGDQVIEHSSKFMDVSRVQQLDDENTGSYQAILQPDGEMISGLADMQIMEKMNEEWIKGWKAVLKGAGWIIADNNLPRETIDYLLHFSKKEKKKLILLGVSSPKTARLPRKLSGTFLALFNADETQAYFGVKETDVEKLAALWISAGCQKAVVTHSTKDIGFADENDGNGRYEVEKAPVVMDATGAGDSFAAGVIYGLSQRENLEEAVKYGMVNSFYTVQTIESVRPTLTEEKLRKELKERFK